MKLEIYQPKPEKEKKEEVLRLRLITSQTSPEGITLAVVDEDGERVIGGSLLVIKPDGTFRRFKGPPLLFQRDLEGRIKETGP